MLKGVLHMYATGVPKPQWAHAVSHQPCVPQDLSVQVNSRLRSFPIQALSRKCCLLSSKISTFVPKIRD